MYSSHAIIAQSNELAEVVSVKLTPDPPKKGEDLTVDADINLSKHWNKIMMNPKTSIASQKRELMRVAASN